MTFHRYFPVSRRTGSKHPFTEDCVESDPSEAKMGVCRKPSTKKRTARVGSTPRIPKRSQERGRVDSIRYQPKIWIDHLKGSYAGGGSPCFPRKRGGCYGTDLRGVRRAQKKLSSDHGKILQAHRQDRECCGTVSTEAKKKSLDV